MAIEQAKLNCIANMLSRSNGFDMQAFGTPPRILITRLSAIGDCIHTVPLAHALRHRFPDAKIVWATQGGPWSLLSGLSCIDEFIRVDRNWMKRLSSIQEMREQLRAYQFDIVIDPQGLTKSSLLGWLTGAPTRIGFSQGQARELSPWLNTTLVFPRQTHVVQRYLELLNPLGVTCPEVRFEIPSSGAAIRPVEDFLKTSSLRRFALINPGAGWDSKLWPMERYAELAGRLNETLGLPSVVLWAGERERQWARLISDQDNVYLAPETTLSELSEFCRKASLFVGSDTGPLHLAAAVGTPCIGMYGPTRPEVCGPFGDQHVVIQAYHQDGSARERRGSNNHAMRAINIDTVLDACQATLVRNQAA